MTNPYDYAACDSCTLSPCVFDDDRLSEDKQDLLCPAIIHSRQTTETGKIIPNPLEWIAFRTEKMGEIERILADRGPVNLRELSDMIDVDMRTLRAWGWRWLVNVTVPPIRKDRCSTFVAAVEYDYDKDSKAHSRPGIKGEASTCTKLTWEQVNNMRKRYAEGGITQVALASRYNITASSVGAIVRREVWK